MEIIKDTGKIIILTALLLGLLAISNDKTKPEKPKEIKTTFESTLTITSHDGHQYIVVHDKKCTKCKPKPKK